MKLIVKEKSLGSFILFFYILIINSSSMIYLNLICTLVQYARIFKFLDSYCY